MSSQNSLWELVEKVHDEASFIDFLEALTDDKVEDDRLEAEKPSSPFGRSAKVWENGTIANFLDAAVRWGHSSINGMAEYEKPDNPWRRAAEIIHAGKFYE